MKKICVLFICLVCLLSSTALAASLTTVDINQIVQNGDQLSVFFHALDENSDCLNGIQGDQIKLEISNQTLAPELQTSDEGVAYVFALDISASLSSAQFDSVKASVQDYVNSMGSHDQMAIVTFGTTVTTVSDFTDNKNTLNAVVNGLDSTSGATTLYEGMLRAIDLAKRQNDKLPTQRVIVVVSDGEDWDDGSNVKEVQESASSAGISICAIGINTGSNSDGLAAMGAMARATGGISINRSESEIADGFNSLRSYLSGGYVVTAAIPASLADGAERAVVLTVSNDGFTVDDSVDFRIKNISSTSVEETEKPKETATTEKREATESRSETAADEQTDESEKAAVEEKDNNANKKGSLSAKNINFTSLFKSRIFIYIVIGCAVALIIGGGVFLFFALSKGKKGKGGDSNGDGRYGENLSKTNDGETVSLEDQGDTGTMWLDECMNGAEIVLTDNSQGRSYTVQKKERISIGRKESANDVVLRDPAVSGTHCEIIQDGDRLYVKDCDSHNGTFVISNGLRYQADSISGQEIQQGDEIELGHVRLELTQC